jgi:protein-S-isoprenylcysteine O-methyltransferase Ste14
VPRGRRRKKQHILPPSTSLLQTEDEGVTVNLRLLTVSIVGMMLVFALTLLLPAGTIAWPAGWAFLLLFFSFVVAISLWLLHNNPGLLTERLTGVGKADQKSWDKLFYVLANVLFLAWLVVMALDAVRFRWSHLPAWLQGVGAIILLGSFWLFFLTFRENSYLSPAIRIQTDRGQTVVSTGPYRYVRHPMYSAFLLFALGTPLLLGSYYGLPFALLIVAALARRTVLEERTLRAELPGYEAYLTTVRYRFIPGVW